MQIEINNNKATVINNNSSASIVTNSSESNASVNQQRANATTSAKTRVASVGDKIVYESDHNKLENRDKDNQHPISAITGLKEALEKAGTGSGQGGKIKDVLVDGTSVVDANGNANISGFVKEEKYNKKINELEKTDSSINEAMTELMQAAEQIGGTLEDLSKADVSLNERMSNLEEVGGYVIEQLGNKAGKNEIPDVSEFIKNTVDNLVNYYLKSEVYNKEEINQLASTISSVNIKIVSTLPTTGETNIIYFVSKIGSTNDVYDEWIYINNSWEHIGSTKCDLTGYATEEWVNKQLSEYMSTADFQDYMNYFYYDKTQVYNKEEIDAKLEDLPSGEVELKATDNIVIEDKIIKGVTNTGYKVIDKDIQMQPINDSGTTGTNKMVYMDDKEIMIIFDGTNKTRRSENGIDFETITLSRNCAHLVYNESNSRLYGTDNISNFFYSDDSGLTWNLISHNRASGVTRLDIGYGAGFRSIYRSTKEIISWTLNETSKTLSQNTRITSTIYPDFIAMVNSTQYIWCNSTGTFKYGAGSNEANFASLSGITVNLLKRVNNITILGLRNNNKIYLLEPATSITAYKWIPYTLPDTCTVNDIIYNHYDGTYYIFTTVNTYYKTKDFVTFESVDKNNFRGVQGDFTLMGIQAVTSNHNELLLAPTRTKIENKFQELDRMVKKELWVGKGLELVDGKVNVKSSSSAINVYDGGIGLGQIDEHNLQEGMIEGICAAKAEIMGLFDPYEIENWYYEGGMPVDEQYKATKFIFNQDGSFYDLVTWEYEIFVEQYDYGYIFGDNNMNVFKYVKLGNLGWLFNN